MGFELLRFRVTNPIDAYTMAGIVLDSGLTIDEFKALL